MLLLLSLSCGASNDILINCSSKRKKNTKIKNSHISTDFGAQSRAGNRNTLVCVCFLWLILKQKGAFKQSIGKLSFYKMYQPAAMYSTNLAAWLNITLPPAETKTVFWYLLNAHCLQHCPCLNMFSLNHYSSFTFSLNHYSSFLKHLVFLMTSTHKVWAPSICSCVSCCSGKEHQAEPVQQVSPLEGEEKLVSNPSGMFLWTAQLPLICGAETSLHLVSLL